MRPPLKFDGKLDLFFRDYISPLLPTSESVALAHERLVKYTGSTHHFLIPLTGGIKRRGKAYQFEGVSRKVVCSDLAAPLWIYEKSFFNEWKKMVNLSKAFYEKLIPVGESPKALAGEGLDIELKWGNSAWVKNYLFHNFFPMNLVEVEENLNMEWDDSRLKIMTFRFLHPLNNLPFVNGLYYECNLDHKIIKYYYEYKIKSLFKDVWKDFKKRAQIPSKGSFRINDHLLLKSKGRKLEGFGNKMESIDKEPDTPPFIRKEFVIYKKDLEQCTNYCISFAVRNLHKMKKDDQRVDVMVEIPVARLKYHIDFSKDTEWNYEGKKTWPMFPDWAKKYIVAKGKRSDF